MSKFRKLRRLGQEASYKQCVHILTQERRASYSVVLENGYPYTVPINFYYDASEHAIYFHGALAGQKYEAVKTNPKVCFCVYEQGTIPPGHWEYHLTSVVVFGTVHLVNETEKRLEVLTQLAKKYYPSEEIIMDALALPSVHSVGVFRIDIDHISGKHVQEK